MFGLGRDRAAQCFGDRAGRRRRQPATATYETDRPAGEPVDADDAPPSRRVVAGRGRRRQHRGAEPLEGERRDEAHPVDFGLGRERHARFGGLRVQIIAERSARRLEEQVVFGEFDEGDAVLLRERMIDGGDHQEFFFEQQLGVDVGVVQRKGEHREIELSAVDLREQ